MRAIRQKKGSTLARAALGLGRLGLPQLDGIAFGIDQARKPPVGIGFGIKLNRNAKRCLSLCRIL